jgi:hypothetical protein
MAYEHVYGIRLDERETEAHIRQKAAAQQRLRSFPPRCVHGLNPPRSHPVMFGHQTSAHNPDTPSSFAALDQLVDKGGIGHPSSKGLANLSLDGRDPARYDPALGAPTSRVLAERPRMERASTSTSGVSVVVPCKKMSTPDLRETAIKTKRNSLATLASSSSEPRVGPPSSPASRIRLPNSDIGDQDPEYTHWGRLDDPDSVWNTLHVERPKLNERRRFSSYKEYRKTRNQPMKDNDQLFKKRMKQSFAREEIEVLSVDGYASDVGEDGDEDGEDAERGGKRVAAKEADLKRQILLVKRKGTLAGQNL